MLPPEKAELRLSALQHSGTAAPQGVPQKLDAVELAVFLLKCSFTILVVEKVSDGQPRKAVAGILRQIPSRFLSRFPVGPE